MLWIKGEGKGNFKWTNKKKKKKKAKRGKSSRIIRRRSGQVLPINLQNWIGLGLLADGLVSRTIKSNWRGSLPPFGAQAKEDRVVDV